MGLPSLSTAVVEKKADVNQAQIKNKIQKNHEKKKKKIKKKKKKKKKTKKKYKKSKRINCQLAK
jgi:hypothetical protein